MEDSNKEKTLNTPSIDEKVYDFIEEVFLGIENKVFGLTSEKEEFKGNLKTREGMLYGMNLLEFYLNQLYKDLVEKSDEFMTNKFEDLGGNINMHPVYTLNIITNVIMKCYPMLPRSKLSCEDKENYLASVKTISLTMKNYMLKIFHDDLEKLNEEKNKEKDE